MAIKKTIINKENGSSPFKDVLQLHPKFISSSSASVTPLREQSKVSFAGNKEIPTQIHSNGQQVI